MQSELDALNNLVLSQGWKIGKKILGEHKAWLQKEINLALEQRNVNKAFNLHARFSDKDSIFRLIEKRIEDLKKEESNA